jgi:hypothetical protein
VYVQPFAACEAKVDLGTCRLLSARLPLPGNDSAAFHSKPFSLSRSVALWTASCSLTGVLK